MSFDFGGGADPTGSGGGTTGTPQVGDSIKTPYGVLLITGVDPITGEPKYQFINNASAGTGAQQFAPNPGFLSAQLNAQANAADLAEKQREYDQTNAYNHAVNDQQYALKQGDLLGSLGGQRTLGGQQLDEQGRQFNSKQALDYYNQLATNASNPRNFVQSFFQQRGQLPPAAANGQGNVDAIQRYLPFLLGQGGQQAGGGNAYTSMPVQHLGAQNASPFGGDPNGLMSGLPRGFGPQATTGGVPAASGAQSARVAQALGPGVSFASGNLGANGQATSAPTTLGGGAPLQPGQTEDPTFQTFRQNVAQNAMSGNVSQEQAMNPKDVGPNGLAIYAKGGIVPEPVIGKGVHSGKTYVFGEHGPEGVVPANYLPQFLQQRGGQMMGGPQGGHHAYAVGGLIGDQTAPNYGDPIPPDPYSPPDSGGNLLDPGLTSNYAGPGGYQVDPNVVNQVLNPAPAPAPTTQNTLTAGAISGPTTTTASGVSAYGTPGGYSAPQASGPQSTTTQAPALSTVAPITGTQPVPLTPQNNFNPFPPTPTTAPTGAVSPIVNQPLGQPQASNSFNASAAAPADFGSPIPQGVAGTPAPQSYLPSSLFPRDTMAPGTFGDSIGNRPQFLPGEDMPDPNSVLGQLNSLNAVPPFLTRLFAQGKGINSMGTNQPQRMDIPKDVPLVSKLAYSQMTPSEQQALLSYASAYGITPEDYMALIEQYAPQGPQSKVPNFGTPFQFARQ